MRKLSIVCLLLLMLVPLRASEQGVDYLFYENIGLGAEASATICFMQDTQGMMWMGTNKGLFSYDGYTVQPHFSYGEKGNTHVYCGVVADSTRFYLGTDNGLIVYNYKTDKYEDVRADLPSDIRTMVMHDGKLWMGSLNGLFSYVPSTRSLSPVEEDLPHQSIYSLAYTADDCLYIGTYNGLCRYDINHKKVETIPLPISRNKSNLFVNALFEDEEHHCVWVGTESGLFCYFPNDGRMEEISGLRNNSVKSIATDIQGRLLVGTDYGLYVCEEGKSLQHVIHDARNPYSLSNNIIWSIFVEGENVWFGTDYGIALTHVGDDLRHIPISQLTGLGEGNQIYTMLRDEKGVLWLGGTNGLIRSASTDAQNVVWYKIGDKRFPLNHNRVRRLYEDREGTLWVASDGSVGRYDDKSQQFTFYNIVDSTRQYNANWAYDVIEDSEGQLWIATCLGGVFVVSKRALMTTVADETYVADKNYSTENGLSGMFSHALSIDHEGNVWAIFYNSQCNIEKISPSTGEITHISRLIHDENTPCCILCANDGYVWIGYYGGVMRLNPADNSVERWSFNSFDTCEVLSMIEADGYIWIATTDGLWVTSVRSLEPHRVSLANENFTSLYYDTLDHKLYMGMTDGYAEVSLETLLEEPDEHSLILTALYVNNEPFPLPQSIRYTTQLTLSHDENNISVEVSDLPYSWEEKSRILYRLEKVEKEWNALAPNTNRIAYNNLKYGHYRLVITTVDAYGNPSDKTYILEIYIRPPFYYTPLAKCIYLVLILAFIVWVIHFLHVRRRLKRERIEKEKVLEQTRAKIDFFTNLSHDLKTPLSMILAPINHLLPQVEDSDERQQLELVQRNAMKLNSLIHQGLDFDQIDNGSNALLVLSRIELVSFARNIFSMYEQGKIKDKQMIAHFETNEEMIYVRADAIKLESILDNILSNAVKYTPNGGAVTLSITRTDSDEVSISVSDNGVGIAQQDQPHIFQRFFQSSRTIGKNEGTGIGLYLVKTYAELHGGRVEISSRENQGTTITIILPVVTPEKDVDLGVPSGTKKMPSEAPLLLVVEDNKDVADFVCHVLGEKYRVVVAENGKEGLEKAKELLPKLIVSDVRMPVMDGMEMVRQLKKYVPTSTIPIIFLTAQSDMSTEKESLHLRADAFIGKPFEPEILLLRVEQLLQMAHTYEKKARIEAIKEPREIDTESYDERFLNNVINVIEAHVSDSDLNVNKLCEWTATSNKQMYRKINQLTGMTPVEFIRSIRMKKAAVLLATKKFTVAEVMYLVGFSNHSYFSKCFSEVFGVTPKQYMG